MRLDKFLCDSNLGTRSEIKKDISHGKVTVDGVTVKKPDVQVDPNVMKITYCGLPVVYAKYYYYMLHKPSGVITASMDGKQSTVMDLIDPIPCKDFVPVGRLDKDTEGLLLITNDGELNHRLLSPKYHVDKRYEVHLDAPISDDMLEALRNGVDIGDDKLTEPASVTRQSEMIVYLTIHEGRFHQVKRMMEAVGRQVVYLKRLSFGNLELGYLEKGAYRPLTDEELSLLKQQGHKE